MSDFLNNKPSLAKTGIKTLKPYFWDLKSIPARFNFSYLSKIEFQNKGKY